MALKLKINLSELAEALSKATVRFPMTIIIALAASILAIYVEELHYEKVKDFIPALCTAYLGISFFLGLSLLGESLKHLKGAAAIQFSGLLLLPLIYFYLDTDSEYMQGSRVALLALIGHLFVAVSAYINSSNSGHFWQFNQNILVRFLLTAFYCAILYGGLCLALVSIHLLFDVKFDKIYFRLFIIISTLFNTWFFCSGIPLSLNEEVKFPKGLKVFTQFVLIPLVILYVLILYAYSAKIIIQWEWPIGWVSTLILGFSICGILAFLLVFPILKEEKNLWLKRLARGIFIALIPLVVLMALSVLRRINEYGITEERYYLSNLVVWLAFVSIVFGLFRSDKIKWIPISLLIFALFNIGGPLSATEVSVRNQKGRLIEGLQTLDLMEDGHWKVNTKGKLKPEEYELIYGPLAYLNNRSRLKEIQDILPFDLDSATGITDGLRYRNTEVILNLMALEANYDNSSSVYRSIYFSRNSEVYELNSEVYDLQFILNLYDEASKEESINDKDLYFSLSDSSLSVSINKDNIEYFILDSLMQNIQVKNLQNLDYKTQKFDTKYGQFYFTCGKHQVKIIVDDFTLQDSEQPKLTRLKTSLWIKINE